MDYARYDSLLLQASLQGHLFQQ